jgi:hypothetical protein
MYNAVLLSGRLAEDGVLAQCAVPSGSQRRCQSVLTLQQETNCKYEAIHENSVTGRLWIPADTCVVTKEPEFRLDLRY